MVAASGIRSFTKEVIRIKLKGITVDPCGLGDTLGFLIMGDTTTLGRRVREAKARALSGFQLPSIR